MDLRLNDKLAIAEVVNNWAIWRDAGDWDRFRTVWHADGWMTATWFQGPAEKFIEVSRAGFEKGVSILHFLGGTSVGGQGRAGDRADEDDDQPARRGRRRGRRRRLHRPVLRLLREARRPLGDRAAPADLREGPDGSGEPERAARARRNAPRRGSPRAIATSPTCRPSSASRSSWISPSSRATSSRACTRTAGRGWTVRRRRSARTASASLAAKRETAAEAAFRLGARVGPSSRRTGRSGPSSARAYHDRSLASLDEAPCARPVGAGPRGSPASLGSLAPRSRRWPPTGRSWCSR